MTCLRLEHPEKAAVSILVTLSGMTMEAREVHPQKVLNPIFVKPFGSMAEARLVHFQKAHSLISLILSGRVIDARLEHPEKALMSIKSGEVPSAIVTEAKLIQFSNAYEPITWTY